MKVASDVQRDDTGGVQTKTAVSPANPEKAMWRNGSAITAIAIVALALPSVAAEPENAPGEAMIEQYLVREADRLSRRVLDGATTREEWEARRPRLKQEYFDMLGLWPLPEKTPLHPRVTGTLERGAFVVEKLHFQSRPGLYVTGNLYRPKEPSDRYSPKPRFSRPVKAQLK
jgi:hypothetical protein